MVMDKSLSKEARRDAFATRSAWLRWLKGGGVDQCLQMIADFGKMGVVERRPGPGDDTAFPDVLHVESQVGFTHNPHFEHNLTRSLKEKVLRHARLAKPDHE